ncbi:hypothetical protein DOLIC_00052 [Dolichomitus sp. PSUC_FEM 10030005]|nr:hypothetical protein [Dolichomitus sp. PSUC_FEM 10030005]
MYGKNNKKKHLKKLCLFFLQDIDKTMQVISEAKKTGKKIKDIEKVVTELASLVGELRRVEIPDVRAIDSLVK